MAPLGVLVGLCFVALKTFQCPQFVQVSADGNDALQRVTFGVPRRLEFPKGVHNIEASYVVLLFVFFVF